MTDTPKAPYDQATQLLIFTGEVAITNIQRARNSALVEVRPSDLAVALQTTIMLLERDFGVCACDTCRADRTQIAVSSLEHIDVGEAPDEASEGVRVQSPSGKKDMH